MTKRKKIFLLLAILSLFICIYTTSKTYAKYITQKNPENTFFIKRWNISVEINDEMISENDEITKTVSLKIDNNEDVAENKIAPASTGSFEINLDYTDTDVDFNYEIKIPEHNELKDLIVYKIKIDDNEINLEDHNNFVNENNENIIKQHVNVNIIDEPKNKIIVYVKWNDDEITQSMNNEKDTNISKNYDTITLEVKIKLTQES